MIAEAKWAENTEHPQTGRVRYNEVEWNGEGAYPGAEKITRIESGDTLTADQIKAIDHHYRGLKAVLGNPQQLTEPQSNKWLAPEYAGVRWRVAEHPTFKKLQKNKKPK